MNKEQKICQNCKQDFTIESEDFDFYRKIDVPPPTFCSDCRLQRRLIWRNERTLHKIKCGLCGKDTLSVFPLDSKINAFCHECWWGDNWNSLDFGSDYDFSKNFFEQFATLLNQVPLQSLQLRNAINSPFTNFVSDSKNIYVSFSTTNASENVFYSKNTDRSTWIFDSFDTSNCDNCYQNVNGDKNYSSIFLLNSRNCIDSAFLYDCVDCQHCILSSNLRNKSFYIRNKSYSKEEYFNELKKINWESFSLLNKFLAEFVDLKLKSINKYASMVNCVGSTGNELRNSKNAKHAFSGYDFENAKFIFRSYGVKDSMDVTNLAKSELVYEFMAAGGEGSHLLGFIVSGLSALNEVYYSSYCGSSTHLFGCIGLRNKQYCILNKQYTKEEYEVLLPKVKQHMMDMPYIDQKGRIYTYGEFFPPELSPFGYNETIAQEYFPLTKAQALSQGFSWKDPDTKGYTPTITSENLPDSIIDVSDSITNEIIQCAHTSCTHQCTTAFKIIPQELEFYRRMKLPLPRLCPNCRHYERLAQRNPLRLWKRQCMCNKSTHRHEGMCPNEFETSYAPERKETVYCEQCYQAEVV